MSGALRQFSARKPAAAGGFDPLSIGWHTAFYADDLTLSDGDPVATWPDSSGNGRDATQATAVRRPVYRASAASLNGQPAVEADAVDDALRTAAFTELSQPNTIVAVLRFKDATTETSWIAHDGIVSTKRHQSWSRIIASNSLAMFAGATITGGTPTTTTHLWVSTFASTSTLEEDGASVISGNAGTQGLTGLTLMNDNSLGFSMNGFLAFLGLKDGLLTAQEKSDLLAWSQSKYATP